MSTSEHDSHSIIKPKERIQADLHTRIDKDVLDSFRHYVQTKHGKINGAFNLELEAALKIYLEKGKTATTTTQNTVLGSPKGIRRDALERFQLIASELQSTDGFPIVNLKTIQAIIGRVLGDVDSRTFGKYQLGVVQFCTEKPTAFGLVPVYDVSKFMSKVQKGFK